MCTLRRRGQLEDAAHPVGSARPRSLLVLFPSERSLHEGRRVGSGRGSHMCDASSLAGGCGEQLLVPRLVSLDCDARRPSAVVSLFPYRMRGKLDVDSSQGVWRTPLALRPCALDIVCFGYCVVWHPCRPGVVARHPSPPSPRLRSCAETGRRAPLESFPRGFEHGTHLVKGHK